MSLDTSIGIVLGWAVGSRWASWPFVGRETETSAILDCIKGGRAAVVLVGEGGVGKSWLAANVVDQLRISGWSTAAVTASLAARDVPYGALAHLLPVTNPPGVLNPLRWAVEELTRPGRRQVLLVDDAHHLDLASAAVVSYLAVHRRATVVATMRADQNAPDAIMALLTGDVAERIRVEPLTPVAATVLLERALAGPVDDQTAKRLIDLSEGNALLLHELVEAARESGALVGPPFRLVAPVPVVAPRLAEIVAARLGSLTEAESEVVEYLALAEPLSVSNLQRLCPVAAIEQCERRGLIRVSGDEPEGRLRLSHPLYGETVRGSNRPLALRRRYRSLVEVVEQSADAPRERLRLAVWRLDAGVPQDSHGLVDAARIAWAAHDYRAAHRLADAAVRCDGTVEGSILLATVLNHTGHTETAAEVLAAVPPDRERPARLRKDLALSRALNLSHQQGRHGEALALLEDEQQHLAEPEFRQDLEVLRIILLGASGQLDLARDLAAAVLAAPAASPAIRAQVLNTLTVCDGMAGRFVDAAAAARAALDTIDHWRDAVPVIVVSLHLNLFRAAMLLGDLAGAEDTLARLAAETVGRSDWEMADSVLLGGRGLLLRSRGRLEDSASAMDSVTTDAIGLGAGIQAERAIALAMMGDLAGAERALNLARQIGSRSPQPHLVEFAPRLAEIYVAAAAGDLDQAVTGALACARDARAKGAVTVAAAALHEAVSLGAAHLVRDQLMELAAQMQGALITLSADRAVAAADKDGPALLTVAERFAELGYLAYAAESAAQGALALAAADGPGSTRSRRAAARASALIGQCQHLRTPPVIALTARQLSAREQQIATLAAEGQTSQQIADRLVLSVRTVDNHLQHVYTKLGVSSRRDLAELI